MKSNYKKLGEYIKPYNQLNENMEIDELLGISNNKYFQRSHTNTIGIDLQTYRIVRTKQFAYNRATTRNGDKISIALRDGNDCIVSPSYRIFESKDENVLHPEYLMMWFRRQEFDRYARFKSHGSAHEFFEYEEMCDVELPIPSITQQMEIVKEYNVLVNRISLNNQLIKKLEETAHVIYKKWFIDFEYPDSNGKPYKSSGGEMEFSEELGKEIPKDWKLKKVSDICSSNSATLSAKDKFETIEYLDTSNITNNDIDEIQVINVNSEEIPSRAKRKVKHNDIIFSTVRPNLRHFGILKNPSENMIVSTGFAVLRPSNPNVCSELIYLTLTRDDNLQNLQTMAEMRVSTYPSINPEDLLDIDFILPATVVLEKAEKVFVSIFNMYGKIQQENKLAKNTNQLLLTRMSLIN